MSKEGALPRTARRPHSVDEQTLRNAAERQAKPLSTLTPRCPPRLIKCGALSLAARRRHSVDDLCGTGCHEMKPLPTATTRRPPSTMSRGGALLLSARRPHTVDGQDFCNAEEHEPKPPPTPTERIQELLQEQLEQRCLSTIVRPIATPPAWRRPWAASTGSSITEKPSQELQQVSTWQASEKQLRKAHEHAMPPIQVNSPSKSKHLMSKVLQELLPLSNAQAETNSKGCSLVLEDAPDRESSKQRSGSVDSQNVHDASGVAAEVAAFRTMLSKSFGNLTRAFRAMKNAVHEMAAATCSPGRSPGRGASASSPGRGSVASSPVHGCVGPAPENTQRLTCVEFEWCVSAHLHYGDKKLARRLFVALDHECKGHIGLLELAQQHRRRGLLSLVEFRRLLLDRHASLAHAFSELEEYLEAQPLDGQHRPEARRGSRSCRVVQLREFVEATAFFGLDVQQSSHFFAIMDADGDGQLTLQEFLDALTQMPRHVLLHDLRKRILVQYPSMSRAFRDLISAGSRSCQLDLKNFSSALAKLGIVDVEASEIFKIIDEDQSGKVSLDEFRDAMREVSPNISIECFWQRFAAEWPEVSAAARTGTAAARERAGTLLLELLPLDLKARYGVVPLPKFRSDDALRGEAIFASTAAPVQPGLGACTPEVFDALAALLDISKSNAQDLFKKVGAAASRRLPSGSRTGPSESLLDITPTVGLSDKSMREVDIEDFLEQLQLWIDNPLHMRLVSDHDSAHLVSAASAGFSGVLQDLLAPSKAAVSALKAELAPQMPEPCRLRDKTSSRGSGRPRKMPKPPWQLISTAVPSLVSVCS